MQFINSIIGDMLMWTFIKSAKWLGFKVLSIYSPDHENVKVVHVAEDSYWLRRSVTEMCRKEGWSK
jgi:hypothetical protein